MPSSSRLVKQQQHRVESKLYSQIVAEGSGSPCRIKVVGVGGGGGNAVNRMIEVSEGNYEFINLHINHTFINACIFSLILSFTSF